jgi:hypothetical protein
MNRDGAAKVIFRKFRQLTPSRETHFRIERVSTVPGQGCVVTGEVVEGIVHPPAMMRIVTIKRRPGVPDVVQVSRVVARGQLPPEVAPGIVAGLTLQGLERTAIFRSV